MTFYPNFRFMTDFRGLSSKLQRDQINDMGTQASYAKWETLLVYSSTMVRSTLRSGLENSDQCQGYKRDFLTPKSRYESTSPTRTKVRLQGCGQAYRGSSAPLHRQGCNLPEGSQARPNVLHAETVRDTGLPQEGRQSERKPLAWSWS